MVSARPPPSSSHALPAGPNPTPARGPPATGAETVHPAPSDQAASRLVPAARASCRRPARPQAGQPEDLHLITAELRGQRQPRRLPRPAGLGENPGHTPPYAASRRHRGLIGPNETCLHRPPDRRVRPGADAASAGPRGQRRPVPGGRRAAVGASSMVPSCSRARFGPGRADGERIGDIGQVGVEQAGRPVLARVGARRQRREGQVLAGPEPDQHGVRAAPAATSPPLSATPGGVTRDQRLAPDGRTKSCQKLLCDGGRPAQHRDGPGALRGDQRGGQRRGTAVGRGAVTGAVCVPQPAARPAQSRPARPVRSDLAHERAQRLPGVLAEQHGERGLGARWCRGPGRRAAPRG